MLNPLSMARLVKNAAELLAKPLGQQIPLGVRHTGQLWYSNTVEPKKLSVVSNYEILAISLIRAEVDVSASSKGGHRKALVELTHEGSIRVRKENIGAAVG
jgi:hypothetical protein